MNDKDCVIIHIGLHKTATSFLQQEVFPKIDKNIVSNEGYSGNYFNHVFNYRYFMIDGIKKRFPNAKIILGVRDSDEWIYSCWRGLVSGGFSRSFDDYKNNFISKQNLDICCYVDYVNSIFNNVFVYDFKDLKSDPDKVVFGICNFCGVPNIDYDNKIVNKSLKGFGLKTVFWFNVIRKYYVYLMKKLDF